MDGVRALFLDMASGCPKGREFVSALEAAFDGRVRVRLQSQPINVGHTGWRHRASNALSELDPDILVVFLSPLDLHVFQRLTEMTSRRHPATPCVVATDETEPERIWDLLDLGAADVVTPPFRAIDILPPVWRMAKQAQTRALRISGAGQLDGTGHMVGRSPAFLAEVAKVPLIAKCDVCVLITGETGTGKEMCARSIHNLSARAKRPFVTVNCGAIPQELLENELFGHVAGAFTGAKRCHLGLIEESVGGTLFLDEVDCLPALAQMKLLRFLEEKEFRPLGSTRVRRVDVRVIAATNADLEKALAEGTFRLDLFYRLNIIPLVLPPLRERVEDIRPLACHFLADYSLRFGKEVMKFSEPAMDILETYPWPGNVRELKNTVARAVVFCSTDTIRAADITLPLRDVPGTGHQESFKVAKARIVEQFERDYIQRVLLANGGNITKAAKAANKNRRALWELIRKHHIDVQKYQIETN